MKFTTIIFDLGNVILTNDWHYECPEKDKEFSDYFFISNDNMEKGWGKFWPDFKLGEITEEEFWRGFLEISGAKLIDIEKAKEIYRKYQLEIEGMPELVRKLKNDYTLVALTNIGKEWLTFKLEKFSLQNTFDPIISSCHSGIAKPNPEIYDILVEKLQRKPEECIFIDDKESNLIPARKLGITTILFTNQEELEKKLKTLNIKF